MHRLKRKNRTHADIGYMHSGGVFDLFDNTMKEAYRINDEEYDFIVERMTDDEMDLFIGDEQNRTFSHRRKLATLLNHYLELYEQSN